MQDFRPATLFKETATQVFSCEFGKVSKNTYFEKHLPSAASVDCKNFYRARESQIEIKISCLFCRILSDFTTCPSVFIVDFEQVNAGWEAKGGETKQVRSTKISFDIFNETMFAFLLHLLIENFKPESYCFKRKNRI